MRIIDRDGNEYEHDGILPDGARMKVPLTMMDSAARKRPLVTDAFGDSDHFAMSRPGFRYPTQRTVADVARALALDDAEEAAANAWRKPPVTPPPASAYYADAAKVGDACTVNGQAGRLVERDGGLICEPDEQHDARMDDREAALREVQMRDEAAWRNAT
jgi:hypothetical protein